MKLLILNLTVRFVMKHPKISALLFCVLFVLSFLFLRSCANTQAVNFTKQIMTRPHCVDAIIGLKAKDAENPQDNELTEMELRYMLQSGYEGIGKTEEEADAEVDKKLNPQTLPGGK